MAQYVALLRGIGPINPNMRNDKIKRVFEGLGFEDVRTVLSTGNVLFESSRSAVRQLESDIENALQNELGFYSTTIIRTRQALERLVRKNPFGDRSYSQKTNLNVTFVKRVPRASWTFPYRPDGKSYEILGVYGQDVCSVVDLTGSKTPDLMARLEKEFGKDITTRSWNTVQKIIRKWET